MAKTRSPANSFASPGSMWTPSSRAERPGKSYPRSRPAMQPTFPAPPPGPPRPTSGWSPPFAAGPDRPPSPSGPGNRVGAVEGDEGGGVAGARSAQRCRRDVRGRPVAGAPGDRAWRTRPPRHSPIRWRRDRRRPCDRRNPPRIDRFGPVRRLDRGRRLRDARLRLALRVAVPSPDGQSARRRDDLRSGSGALQSSTSTPRAARCVRSSRRRRQRRIVRARRSLSRPR